MTGAGGFGLQQWFGSGMPSFDTISELTSGSGVTIDGVLLKDGGITVTAPVLPGSGTAAAPSYAFSTDADTGLYRSAANTLGFAVGGASVGTWASTALAVVTPISTTRGVSSGTALKVGGRANSFTASSTTISGGSGAQAYDVSYTIPASSLGAGDKVRIQGQVKAIAQNSTDTFTVAVKIGSTTIWTSSSTDIAANDRCVFDLWVGTTAAAGAAVDSRYGGAGGWSTAGAAWVPAGGAGNLATNGALAITVEITYGSSNSGNQSALEFLSVEVC